MYRIRWRRVFILILIIVLFFLYRKFQVSRIPGDIPGHHKNDYIVYSIQFEAPTLAHGIKFITINPQKGG